MTNRDLDRAVLDVAGRQAGWFTAGQAAEAGATNPLMLRRVRSGAWVVGHPGVYRPEAYPDSYVGRLWAAHLGAGPLSYVSHEAAAKLHGLAGFGREQLVLTLPHPLHARLKGVVVHQLTDTALHELRTMHGLTVTTPAWTLVDVAATASKARVRAALEDALASRLVTVTEVGKDIAMVTRRGRRAC